MRYSPTTSLSLLIALCIALPPVVQGQTDVLTARYSVMRTGANLHETVLTSKNVSGSQFGKLFERVVDGDIYAQPLIKTAVPIPGAGIHNVVYVATVNNSLFAFDADSTTASQPLWVVSRDVFGEPVFKNETVDLEPGNDYHNFSSVVGIVATPVIDDKTSTIYVVAFSKKAGRYRFRLHAMDLATGKPRMDPVEVQGSYNGNGVGSVDGKIQFQARKMMNRPALLLIGGVVYLAFTAHADGEPQFDYHGWIMAYDTKTLKQLSVLCTTPDGIQGGIWQSGGGLMADEREGTFPLIYAVVGNGTTGGRNVAQSVVQMYPGHLLSVKQAFTPANHEYQNDRDLDLSTGPVLLPDLPFITACSKEGKCYVVDRTTMTLVQEFAGAVNSYGGERAPNIHGGPVIWRNSQGKLRLYVWGEEDYLRTFQFDGQRFVGAGKSKFAAPTKSMPGGILALSADGAKDETAVLWASIPSKSDANMETVDGVLRAFDANDVEKELWNSEQNAARDRVGMFAKFCPPVIANGKVYVATFAPTNKLVVYGQLTDVQSRSVVTSR